MEALKKTWKGVKYTLGMIMGICIVPLVMPVMIYHYIIHIHKNLTK